MVQARADSDGSSEVTGSSESAPWSQVASDRLASAGPRHHEAQGLLSTSVGKWGRAPSYGSESRLRVTRIPGPPRDHHDPGLIRVPGSPGSYSPARIRKPDHEAAARRRHHAMMEARAIMMRKGCCLCRSAIHHAMMEARAIIMRNGCCPPAPGPGPGGCGGRGSLAHPARATIVATS